MISKISSADTQVFLTPKKRRSRASRRSSSHRGPIISKPVSTNISSKSMRLRKKVLASQPAESKQKDIADKDFISANFKKMLRTIMRNLPGYRRELTPAEMEKIRQLQAKDQELRLHERAHLSAGRAHALGNESFVYETGPDGKLYAKQGAVGVDVGIIPNNPEASLRKAETLRKAAMAPGAPSVADFAVRARATALAMYATGQLKAKELDERQRSFNLERMEECHACLKRLYKDAAKIAQEALTPASLREDHL